MITPALFTRSLTANNPWMKRITKITAIFSVLMMLGLCLHAQVKHHVTHRYSLKAAIASGAKLYADNCLSCHQADALGVPNMNPPLVKTEYVLGDKTRL